MSKQGRPILRYQMAESLLRPVRTITGLPTNERVTGARTHGWHCDVSIGKLAVSGLDRNQTEAVRPRLNPPPPNSL